MKLSIAGLVAASALMAGCGESYCDDNSLGSDQNNDAHLVMKIERCQNTQGCAFTVDEYYDYINAKDRLEGCNCDVTYTITLSNNSWVVVEE
jgi:hypothetical protein